MLGYAMCMVAAGSIAYVFNRRGFRAKNLALRLRSESRYMPTYSDRFFLFSFISVCIYA